MPKNTDEWFTILEKAIKGISGLKEPFNNLAAKSKGTTLDSAGFKPTFPAGFVGIAAKNVVKNIVKKLQKKEVFEDIKNIVDVILRIEMIPQIQKFVGKSPTTTYIANSATNILTFLRDEVLVLEKAKDDDEDDDDGDNDVVKE